jgi:hypothetical protein
MIDVHSLDIHYLWYSLPVLLQTHGLWALQPIDTVNIVEPEVLKDLLLHVGSTVTYLTWLYSIG